MARGDGNGKGRGGCVQPAEAWEMVKEWGWKILSWICCLLCTGPILTLIGVLFLISAVKDERGDNVKKFNAGVAQFNAIRTEWEGRTFTTTSFASSVLAITSKEFTVEDSKLAAWDPLYYRVTGSPAGFTSASATATVAVDFSENAAVLAGASPVNTNRKVQLSTSSVTSSGSSSSGPRPPPPPPTPPMDRWYELSKICRQVSDGAGNGYHVAGSPSGPGCFNEVTGSISSSNTQVNNQQGLTWTRCGSDVLRDAPAPAECSTFSVEATLRSEKDPVVLGFNNGACGRNPSNLQCSFGLSRTSKIVLGLIFLIIGLTWTCCVYGGLYAVILYFQKRNK